MDESINLHDLILEVESLRKELLSLTPAKDELQKTNLLFSHSEQWAGVNLDERPGLVSGGAGAGGGFPVSQIFSAAVDYWFSSVDLFSSSAKRSSRILAL